MESKPIDITDTFGSYGLWQKKMFAFAFITTIFYAWNDLVMAFFAPNVEYWCAPPDDIVRNGTTLEDWLKTGVPWIVDESGHARPSKCQMYDIEQSSMEQNRSTVKCTRWEFDRHKYPATIIDEWNLVCQHEWLISFAQSIYMTGFLTSMIVFGHLSDRFGRRPVALTASCIFIISGFACLQTSHFRVFTVMRFLVSFGLSGVESANFIILMEVTGADYRSQLGVGINYGWATGYVLLPALAWLVPRWYNLQLLITAPSVGLLLAYWLVPESPRWLMTKGKSGKAQKIVMRAAAVNGKDVTEAMTLFCHFKEKGLKTGEKISVNHTVLDLLKGPKMRKKSLNLFFCWFVNAFIYYGLSLNTNELGGDPFLNFFISGAIEFPAYAAATFAIKKLGRRIPLATLMAIRGIACLLTIPIPAGLLWLRVTLAMAGKFCITASFGVIYVFSAETFPTVMRNTGVGWSSTCGRMGATIAPFIKELGRATHAAVPFIVYGSLSLVSAFLVYFLPETFRCKLPDTLEEGENFGINCGVNSFVVEDEMEDVCTSLRNDEQDTTNFNQHT